MARIRMITRTVTTTVFDVMVVNQSNMQVESVSVSVASADSLSADKQIGLVRENLSLDYLFVKITGSHTEETLYGMTEEEFIRLAKVLPPRSSKSED